MKRVMSTLVLLILSCLPCVMAADQPPRIRNSDLDTSPINVGPIKIRMTKFRGSLLKIGNGSVEIEVENTSKDFARFNPQSLSFVGSDDRQVDILAIQSGDHYWPAAGRDVAPGARTREYYALNGKVRLPARVYYEQREIAVVVD
jgi:hypothetical protein